MIVFLFSSQSFNDATRRLQYVKQYRSYRAEQAVKINSAGKQLKNKITVLNEQKQKKDFVLIAQEHQNKILQAETEEKNKVVSQLKGKEKELMLQLAKNKKAADDLNRAISNAIKREIEMARKRAMDEKKEQEKLRRLKADQERRLLADKQSNAERAKREEEAKRLAEAKRVQQEREKQALADKLKREEQERKLTQEKKEREAKEQALAIERKKREEAERNASLLAENKRIEKERQLAIERNKQEERERQLNIERQKQEDRQRQLLAERQRQEENQRQLAEDKKKQDREQARLNNAPYSNPRYVKTIAEKENYDLALNRNKSDNRGSKIEEPEISEVSNTKVKTFEKDDYKFSLTPEERALTNNFEANKGRLPWPVEKGYIAEHFGKNKHPLFNVVTENYGVDIKTSRGAIARSIYAGEVNSIINVPGMGQTVLINHGSFYTVYSKLARVSVSKGTKLNMKQSIGTVMTDDEGDTFIHFEIWKVGANGTPYKMNPEQWVAQ
jgi:septal ring factor EnvC (AmiA/AmiB activator)